MKNLKFIHYLVFLLMVLFAVPAPLSYASGVNLRLDLTGMITYRDNDAYYLMGYMVGTAGEKGCATGGMHLVKREGLAPDIDARLQRILALAVTALATDMVLYVQFDNQQCSSGDNAVILAAQLNKQ